jgi:hypothetical protein
MKNQTWELQDLPQGKKPITNKKVFKTKLITNDTIEKFKAKLMARNFEQIEGIDF